MQSSDPKNESLQRGAATAWHRLLIFVLISAACVAAVSWYVLHVRAKASAGARPPPVIQTFPAEGLAAIAAPGAPPFAPAASAIATSVAAAAHRPLLMFRHMAPGNAYGQLGVVHPVASEARSIGALSCERLHFAAGSGICLEARRTGLASYYAHLFDDRLAVRHSMLLAGVPSRARVSPDGRLGAFTVFVSGHSYNAPGFSTQTSIVDTANGQALVVDLESWEVQRHGAPIRGADFNFWGVTFTPDSRRFFATLGGGGKLHLVEGDIAARRMRVVHEDVECPSLSPDGTRIAFKRRAPMDAAGRRIWRLVVLDLATRRETLLDKETRNVDDQVEWLDDREIIYGMPQTEMQASASTDLWALAADASAPPRLLLPFAFSPAVLR